jgi:hypothetical protein
MFYRLYDCVHALEFTLTHEDLTFMPRVHATSECGTDEGAFSVRRLVRNPIFLQNFGIPLQSDDGLNDTDGEEDVDVGVDST